MRTIAYFLISILSILQLSVQAQESFVLPELTNPETISIDKNNIFITEGCSIYIYSKETLKFKKKFGKPGEGPQEFKINPQVSPLTINIQTDQLIAHSMGKLSYWTKQGEYLKEQKLNSPLIFNLQPIGENFVGMGFSQNGKTRFRVVNLYNTRGDIIKEIVRVKHNFQSPGSGYKVLSETFDFQTYKGKIIIASENEFKINIYDKEGTFLLQISQPYTPKKVEDKDKERIITYFKTDPTTKSMYDYLKPILFPDIYPAIRVFYAADNYLYVMTWKKRDINNEFIIFLLSGQIIKTTWIPIHMKNELEPFPFKIKDKKLYQLIENEEDENWSISITKIKL